MHNLLADGLILALLALFSGIILALSLYTLIKLFEWRESIEAQVIKEYRRASVTHISEYDIDRIEKFLRTRELEEA